MAKSDTYNVYMMNATSIFGSILVTSGIIFSSAAIQDFYSTKTLITFFEDIENAPKTLNYIAKNLDSLSVCQKASIGTNLNLIGLGILWLNPFKKKPSK